MLLENTHNNIRDKRWSEPAVKETMKAWWRVARAREEIDRCNVEIRRLHTAICDEHRLFDGVLSHMHANNPLRVAVEQFCRRRTCINASILARVRQVYELPGFSGVKGPGTWLYDDAHIRIVSEPEFTQMHPDDEGGDDAFEDEFASLLEWVEGLHVEH